MINKQPLEVIQDIMAPLVRRNVYFQESPHAIQVHWYSDLSHSKFLQSILLERIYSYFLYPPSCLCDIFNKNCLCDEKRQEIQRVQSLNTYVSYLEWAKNERDSELYKWNINGPDIYRSTYSNVNDLSEEKFLDIYRSSYKSNYEFHMKQSELLTGITKENFDFFNNLPISPQSNNWKWDLYSKAMDVKSHYYVSGGIGLHFLAQCFNFQNNKLKTSNGRLGFISLNNIVNDVLNNQSLQFFGGIKFSKRKIVHAFYQYRSILHFIIAHSFYKNFFSGAYTVDSINIFFASAYHAQQSLLEASSQRFTPLKLSPLFTVQNMAYLTPPLTNANCSQWLQKKTSLKSNAKKLPYIYFEE